MWQALETDRNRSLGSISGIATVVMPETTDETNKSNADAASIAAGSTANEGTMALGRWKHRECAVHRHSSERTSDNEDRRSYGNQR
jgi:hypothetical protein